MDRQEWLKLRKNYIGASDAPVIMNGEHFKKTPYKLWQEKLGLIRDSSENWATRYGTDLEPIAHQAYEKYTKNKMIPQVKVFHSDHKFMMATLDGLSENGDLAVEIKCPNEIDHNEAKNGKIPTKYYAQVQHQLACIGINRLHYFSYRNDDIALVEIERDESYIRDLYKKEGHFWEKVMNFEAPSLNEKDFHNMEEVEGWKERADRWVDREAIFKALEKERKADRQWFIDHCGKHNAQGHGIKLLRTVAKGTIDYKAIPELEKINLEKYRNKPIERWNISLVQT